MIWRQFQLIKYLILLVGSLWMTWIRMSHYLSILQLQYCLCSFLPLISDYFGCFLFFDYHIIYCSYCSVGFVILFLPLFLLECFGLFFPGVQGIAETTSLLLRQGQGLRTLYPSNFTLPVSTLWYYTRHVVVVVVVHGYVSICVLSVILSCLQNFFYDQSMGMFLFASF